MANHRVYAVSLAYFLLTIAAVLLIAKPASVNRLIVLVVLQVSQVFINMPAVSNHWLFTAFVNLTILQSFIYLAFRGKTFVINKEALLKTFAPVVRIELLILYFYVVFHKLNADFFTPQISCATDFLLSQDSTGLLVQNKTLVVMNAYVTIGIEALIPILLCIRRTRNAGVLIGLVFHCVLAFNPRNGFYDFSSMIFGTYVLFMSENFTGRVYRIHQAMVEWKNRRKKYLGDLTLQRLAAIFVVGIMLLGVFIAMLLLLNKKDFFRDVFWSAFSFSFIGIFLLSLFKARKQTVPFSKHPFKLPAWSFAIIPLAVFLNGLSPYLGLKTENSFAMFSNLRTEGMKTNHLIVPVTSQLFDYQKDLVEVVSSTDTLLAKTARENQLMAYFSFKNYINAKKPTRVEYIRHGQPTVFERDNPATHGDLLQPIPITLRKFLSFRTISKYDPQPCNH